MTIKAIETQYKGYRFRSRLEARWAVFFDALGVEWVYEVEGFELDNGTRYLPDFWIKKPGCWIEIKGESPTHEEVDKAGYLAAQTRQWVNIVYGNPWPGEYGVMALRENYPDESIQIYAELAVQRNERWIINSLLSGRYYTGDVLRKGTALHGWKLSTDEENQKPYRISNRCFCFCEFHKTLSFGHMIEDYYERCSQCGSVNGFIREERKWEMYGRCFTAENTQEFDDCPSNFYLSDNKTLRDAFSKARSARFEHGENGNV